MFESYQQNQKRTWSPAKLGLFVGAVAILALGIRAYLVHSGEQRDIETMNEAFAMTRPSRPIAPSAPALAKLPGMSIEVPDHLVITGDYEHGTAVGALWALNWTPGEQTGSEAESEKLIAYVAQRTGHTAGEKRTVELGGHPGYSVEMLGHDPQTMMMTVCGGRSIQITTSLADAAALESARASFRCTPTMARLASRSVAVAPRAGWHVKPIDSALVLTKDDVNVILTAGATEAPRGYMNAFTVGTPERRGKYTVQRGTVAKEDNSIHPGAVVSWPCPERETTGYAFVAQWGEHKLDEGISLALTARCYGPDEPLPAYD